MTPPCIRLQSRTRHLKSGQSKNGCYTCRARRKKCDEARPACLRCNRAGRICEGYRNDELLEPTSTPVSTATNPCTTLIHLTNGEVQTYHSHLGLKVLLQETFSHSFGAATTTWTSTLPQLCTLSPCVHAAVTSLGAFYDSVMLRDYNDHATECPTDLHYCKALSLLQHEISTPTHGPIPLFLACIVLAAVEALQHRLINALTHLRGAFRVLRECIDIESAASGDSQGLRLMAQSLDIQTATYALSSPPELPLFRASPALPPWAMSSLEDIYSEFLPLLHGCYHFTSTASVYKYALASAVPRDMVLEQGRYIASLSQWLARLYVLTEDSGLLHAESMKHSVLVLQIQCIGAIIYLSSILNPYERSYDSYNDLFDQVVSTVSVILGLPRSKKPQNALDRFRLMSTVSQPLHLTAMKCRDKDIRRKAIQLMGQTDREGPWDSAIHVAVAKRAMELEEVDPEGDITDTTRIHGCGIDSDGLDYRRGGRIKAVFSRCRNVDSMVASGDWEAARHWDIWTEQVDVQGRAGPNYRNSSSLN